MPRIIIDIEDEKDLEFLRSESAKSRQSPADWLRSKIVNGILSSPGCLDDTGVKAADIAIDMERRAFLRRVNVYASGV